MLTNDEKQHQDNASLSASPSQQTQLSLPQYSQTDNGANILVTTQSALNTDFLDCMTRNLLATTVAGISEQQPPVSAATAAAVAAVATAAAFGLSVPDVSMMYNHVNLNHLFNLNLLTQSQQSQQLPQSSSLSSPSSSFLMEYLRQRTLAEANTQQPQQLHLKLQQQQQQQQQQRSQHHHHNQQQQQRQRQQRPSKEKKRSYPCSFQWCELCMREVHSSKLPCHIRQHHVAQPMFICPQCKFSSSYSKNNVKSHMSTVHGLTEEPISHMEEYADEVEQLMKKCFPTVRGRGRPMHAGNTRPSTASSSSSLQAESNSNSRRSSASSVISASSTAGRYTHSHRRRGSKYPAQETAQDLLSITYSKRVKRHELSNESELASTETRVDASGQSSPSEEDSAANVSGMHSSANEKSYTKSGKETSSYRNGIANFDGNDEITDGYTDGIDSYHTENTNLHDKNEQNETVANDNSPSSSEHVSNDAELETDSNDSSMQDFDEGEAHLKSNDYTQPRYLPQNINYCMLTDDQMKGTIFENFQLSELLHRIPRETLRSNNITFVREDKLNQIELVRQQISVDMTAIRDALCNLNLSILPVEQVDQIASIAPSVIDVSYLLNYESMEPALVIGENEQFLLKLAKIDRVAEKLHAMSFMGHINSRTTEILKSLEDLISATNALRKNRGFHVLIRVVLVFINFIIGDYAAKTSRGFRISDLTKICSTEVCSSPKTTLLNVVASCTISEFTEVCMIRDTLPALEKASRVNFQELSVTIRRLEQDYLRFDREVSYMDSERHVSACRESIKNKVTEVKESFQECKTILCKTMRYFGEFVDDDIGVEIPEAFFAAVATFCRQLQRAWIDVHLHGIQGTKAVQ